MVHIVKKKGQHQEKIAQHDSRTLSHHKSTPFFFARCNCNHLFFPNIHFPFFFLQKEKATKAQRGREKVGKDWKKKTESGGSSSSSSHW